MPVINLLLNFYTSLSYVLHKYCNERKKYKFACGFYGCESLSLALRGKKKNMLEDNTK